MSRTEPVAGLQHPPHGFTIAAASPWGPLLPQTVPKQPVPPLLPSPGHAPPPSTDRPRLHQPPSPPPQSGRLDLPPRGGSTALPMPVAPQQRAGRRAHLSTPDIAVRPPSPSLAVPRRAARPPTVADRPPLLPAATPHLLPLARQRLGQIRPEEAGSRRVGAGSLAALAGVRRRRLDGSSRRPCLHRPQSPPPPSGRPEPPSGGWIDRADRQIRRAD